MPRDDESVPVVKLSVLGTICAVVLIGLPMYGCPQYSVYEQRLAGEAELAKAEFSRQVQIRDAEGKLAAASKLAEVEVKRAEGIAKANQIIGDSLKGNEAYLRWRWIEDVAANPNGKVIYVPTEANMPVLLEAGKGPQR